MKKVYLAIAAMFICAGIASAQDLESATEKYNNGSAALSNGNKIEALSYFKASLEEALLLEDSENKTSLVSDCALYIPKIAIMAAKDSFKEKDFDAAFKFLDEAKVFAEKYDQFESLAEISTLVPQFLLQKGNEQMKAKDYAAAAESYNAVLAQVDETSPLKGVAALSLGNCLVSAGDNEAAIAAYTTAAACGKEKDANKKISGIYLTDAQKFNKAGQYKEAVAAALKANEYVETPNAYKLLGASYQKLGDNKNAVESFEKYLASAGNAKDAASITYAVASLYQKMGNKAKAIENYQKVVTDPKLGPAAGQQLQALQR